MICKNCGSMISEGTAFCQTCGAPVSSGTPKSGYGIVFRIVSGIIVLVSVLMLFLPWMAPSSSGKAAFDAISAVYQMYESKVESGMASEIGIDNAKKAKSLLDSVIDGKISPFEYLTICASVNSLVKFGAIGDNLDIPEFSRMKKSIHTVYIVVLILFLLMALSGLLAAILHFIGKKSYLDIIYFIMTIIMFVLTCVIMVKINELLRGIGDIGSYLDLPSGLSISFSITAFSIIALITSLPFSLYSKLIPGMSYDGGQTVQDFGGVNYGGADMPIMNNSDVGQTQYFGADYAPSYDNGAQNGFGGYDNGGTVSNQSNDVSYDNAVSNQSNDILNDRAGEINPEDYNKTVYVGFGDKKKSDSGAHGVVTHKTENKDVPPPEPMNLNNAESNAEKAETGIPMPNENAAVKAPQGGSRLKSTMRTKSEPTETNKNAANDSGINQNFRPGGDL